MKRIFFALCAVALLVSCDPVEPQSDEVNYVEISHIMSTYHNRDFNTVVDVVHSFNYDVDGDLERIDAVKPAEPEAICYIEFTYGVDELFYNYVSPDVALEQMRCKLSSGNMISSEYEFINKEDDPFEEHFSSTYSYDNGYLVRCVLKWRDEDGEFVDTYALTWEDGNLARITYDGSVERLKYSEVSNRTNVDLNWFLLSYCFDGVSFCTGDTNHLFASLGYAGKRSSKLIKSVSSNVDPLLVKFEYECDSDGNPIVITEWVKDYGDVDYVQQARHEISYR